MRRALLSVHDKTGVEDLGRALCAAGVEVLSTGGTARVLREAGVPVVDVARFTGSPEVMGGRVKTLHPRVHGGILARRGEAGDLADLEALGGGPIDLVAVNLYPFRGAVAAGADDAGAVEQIDVGGPALLRAAAKNHAAVVVLCDPADYGLALLDLDGPARRRLAAKAFAHTAAYDADVAEWMRRGAGAGAGADAGADGAAPGEWAAAGRKRLDLRYGENPHQRAAFYATGVRDSGLAAAEALQGKALSYNNLLDADACLRILCDLADLPDAACVIVKHTNPCGAALSAAGPGPAFEEARACDPASSFGGIVGFTRTVDAVAARALAEHFLEVVLAPGFTAAAREVLGRKKAVRLLALPADALRPAPDEADVRRVRGGLLVQDPDAGPPSLDGAAVATARAPTEAESRALSLAWRLCRHVKSNAIAVCDERRLVGVGAGQMSRVDAARLAVGRAVLPVRGTCAASDAFFPFRDGLDVLGEAGVTAVVQPGGSRNDAEVVAAADARGMAMLLTGRRHFRH